VRRGVAFLESSQRADGSYPEQAVAGVFFGTAMLHYRLYKAYFPVWALSRAGSQERVGH
jgi:lanosterol synthase